MDNQKANTDLCILIANFNTSDFLELNLYALSKLTLNRFYVLINDNGSDDYNIRKLKALEHKYDFAEVYYRKNSKPASFAHAEALDFLIPKSLARFTVILDSDCIPLLKGWDRTLMDLITDKVKIVGSPLAKESCGNKPSDFPFQFLVLFETEVYKSLNICAMPGDIQKGEDTCWQWRPKFLSAGYEARILRAEVTRYYKDGTFKNVLCDVYYDWSNNLIASHFGRASDLASVRYRQAAYRLPLLGKRLAILQREMDKISWLNKCKRVIESQIE